ncbi:LPXTG cell wall anchor domain-containing protein [Levilactobacillus zymae]|uniref:LPXTG cell wall anchor domain-containing protein n=1 Tax=Levilactobacillus zymae TaxID=267363 RepID=UPI0028B61242|nr:LPXTG cell wall anchor domain-containing protein [Levilactobacillus zymae]MDT6979540.1 LPXTG cell wall anchor domain-containing protein [Levilactobacillus zymae]
MTKKFMQLMLVLTLILGFSGGTSALAATGTGHTTTGITFVGGPTNTTNGSSSELNSNGAGANGTTAADNGTDPDGAASNKKIPNGKKPITKTGKSADQVAPTTHRSAVKAITTAVLSGRLPQTNEVQSVLIELIGLLLLVVLVLSIIIRRQARLLREKE